MEESLERLGVDHVDLLWAHAEDRTVPLKETVGAFGELVTKGVALPVGAANHAAWSVERARSFPSLPNRGRFTLEQWSPGSRGLMVLDALDAARADAAGELWRLLIRQVHQRLPHWRVVASIRTWDLVHSVRLGSLISGDAVVVGDFDDAEFHEITRSLVSLAELETSSEEQVKRLLRNPFMPCG